MQSSPGSTWVAAALLLGCSHAGAPPGRAAVTERLWLRPQAGSRTRARMAVQIESDVVGRHGAEGATRHVVIGFHGFDHQTVEAVADDGSARITARLADVVGEASPEADEEAVRAFARALDQLVVGFRRSPRGEGELVSIDGLAPPLDERTARLVAQALYATGRGPFLPDRLVELGALWTMSLRGPTALGVEADIGYEYRFVRKDSGVAMVTGRGKLEGGSQAGEGGQRRLTGAISSEYRVELARARLIGSVLDSLLQVEQRLPGQEATQSGVRQRVRAQWTLEDG